MVHSSSAQNQPNPSKPRLIASGLAVAAALGVWLTTGGSFLSTSRGDSVPAEKQQQLLEEFSQVRDVELQPVNLADPAEKEQAMASLDLPTPEAKQIINDAEKGEVKLAWITLWDNADEDGDIVQVYSNGYTRSVTLNHHPKTLVIPYIHKGQIVVTGVHDGGGGITVSAKTAGGSIPFPSMAEGQKFTLPLQ